MWDDWMERYNDIFRDEYGRLCNTQYEMNMKPKVKFHGVDYCCDKRVYQVNCKYIAIPTSMNKESCYKKAEYVKQWYPWLDNEEFNELVHFLNTEVIKEEIPVAEWHEPPKELTADEKFEKLKNNIRKKNEIQRKPKKNIIPRIDLVTITAIMMLLVTLGRIIISKGVVQ